MTSQGKGACWGKNLALWGGNHEDGMKTDEGRRFKEKDGELKEQEKGKEKEKEQEKEHEKEQRREQEKGQEQ